MAVIYHSEPKLNSPALIASWPGIGDIGVIAVGTLRRLVGAEEFAEIEPYEFFYPKRVYIRNGELKDMEFPASKFYYSNFNGRSIIIFIGDEQPAEGGRRYADGPKAYQMANMVLDVAVKFGCSMIYTSGAAVAPLHHTLLPQVWAVPNSERLLEQARGYKNTVLMSNMEGRSGGGAITGLNGLLLGVARKRGLDATCLMGEVPAYLQGFPVPYPKASRAVLQVLGKALDIDIDTAVLETLIEHTDRQIETIYDSLPAQIKEQLDKLKHVTRPEPGAPVPSSGPITEEDKKRIMEDIDKMFKKEPKGD